MRDCDAAARQDGDEPDRSNNLLSTRLGLPLRALPPVPPQIVRQLVDHGTVVGFGPGGRSPEHSQSFFIHTRTFQHSSSSVISEFNARPLIHRRRGDCLPGQPTIYIRMNSTTASRRQWPAAYCHHMFVRRPVSTRPPLTLNAWSDFSLAVCL